MQQLLQFFSNVLSGHIDSQSLATLVAALIPLIGGGIWASIKFAHSNMYSKRKDRRAKKLYRKEQQVHQRQAAHSIERYRSNIPNNPKIVQVQILDMDHPLNLIDLYVPLRVYPKSSLRYAIDPILSQAEETHDPNVVLQAARKSLELRVAGALDPDEAIRRYRRCVVIGNPGVGKTTLLRYLAIQAASKKLRDLPTIPIYIELRTFKWRIHKDLFDLILEQLGDTTNTAAIRTLLQEQMRDGKVLLLLDGLDETKFSLNDTDAALVYTHLIEAITNLSDTYKEMPIVVTVRKAGYQHQQPLRGFHTLEVVDFQPEDSQAFLANWFHATQSADKEEKIQDLTSHLERNLRMQALASNPLLLSLIVIVYQGHLTLPERRAKLYSQCIEVLQSKWDAKRNVRRRQILSLDSQSLLLQEIAWHFHLQGKHYFPKNELLQVIASFLSSIAVETEQSEKVLRDITRINGILLEQAHGWYGFSHLTFQEYFVMLHVKAPQELDYILQHVNNPWWEEVLLLYVGNSSDASPLLKTLLDSNRSNDPFQSGLIIAGRCLGEKPVIRDTTLRKEITDQLFHLLETTPYALLREQAANALVVIGKHYVNGRLMQMIEVQNKNLQSIQESVILALGRSGGRELAHELIHILSRKQVGRYLRILIARAICNMNASGEPHVAQALSAILMDKQDDVYVRQSIALTVSTLDKRYNQKIIDELILILERKDEHALVLQSVILALGTLNAREVVPTLSAMLLDEQLDWHVRGSIVKVLSKLDDERVIHTLLKVLANNADNTYVRRRIAISISLNAARVPIETLLGYLDGSVSDVKVCCSIARTLGSIGNPAVIPHLIALLIDQRTDAQVKASLAMALGILGKFDHQVISTLDRLRQDPQCDLNLKGCILSALAMFGYNTVFPDLLALMSDPQLSQDVLLDIIHAIGHLSDREHHLDRSEIAYQLTNLLAYEHLDRFRGQNIARVVGVLGERTIVPKLLLLLENRSIDRYTRQDIADAIGQLAQDEESSMKLRDLLATTDITDEIYRALWKVCRQVNSKNGIVI